VGQLLKKWKNKISLGNSQSNWDIIIQERNFGFYSSKPKTLQFLEECFPGL